MSADQTVCDSDEGIPDPLRADPKFAALVAIQIRREWGQQRIGEQAGVGVGDGLDPGAGVGLGVCICACSVRGLCRCFAVSSVVRCIRQAA